MGWGVGGPGGRLRNEATLRPERVITLPRVALVVCWRGSNDNAYIQDTAILHT